MDNFKLAIYDWFTFDNKYITKCKSVIFIYSTTYIDKLKVKN